MVDDALSRLHTYEGLRIFRGKDDDFDFFAGKVFYVIALQAKGQRKFLKGKLILSLTLSILLRQFSVFWHDVFSVAGI